MKKNSLVTIFCVVIISLSLIASLFLDGGIGSRIVNVVTVITAIIGAVALFIQFKKDKQVNTASFLMDYSKSFYYEYNLLDLFVELDKHNSDQNYTFDVKKYQAKIIMYLEWIEQLASLIERDVIDLYAIDNTLAYRFFIIVNNKQVQDLELLPNAEYYRGTYYLFDRWYNYEQKRGLKVPLAETGLHLTKNYEENLQNIKAKIKNK